MVHQMLLPAGMNTRLALLFGCLTLTGAAQAEGLDFSWGVKAGIPITDAFETARGNSAAYVSNTQRYTIGPTVEFHISRFSIEADALYNRLGFDNTFAGPAGSTTFEGTRADSWVFPVLGKFEILPGPIRPFVDAGASFRHISGVSQVRSALSAGTFGLVTIDNPAEFNKRTDIAFTFGGGIAFKAGPVRISPEFRYNRWGGENFRDPINALLQTSRNEGVFLLGLTF
jgi:opacity protein-like surface antigen